MMYFKKSTNNNKRRIFDRRMKERRNKKIVFNPFKGDFFDSENLKGILSCFVHKNFYNRRTHRLLDRRAQSRRMNENKRLA